MYDIFIYALNTKRGASAHPRWGSVPRLSIGEVLLGDGGCGVGFWGQEWLVCFVVSEANVTL